MDIRALATAYGATKVASAVKAEKKVAPEKSTTVLNEQVELSEKSLSMQKLSDIIDATPNIRIKFVEEIRTKIKYNGYPIESKFYKAIENMVNEKII